MDVSSDLTSGYLSKRDITEPTTFVIKAAERKKFEAKNGRPEEKKVVVLLEGEKHGEVLFANNKTNLRTIVEAWGKDTDAWIDRQIVIWNNPDVMFGSDRTGGGCA